MSTPIDTLPQKTKGSNELTTGCNAFFNVPRGQVVVPPPPGSEKGAIVIGVGIDDAKNIGSIFRLMACFGSTEFQYLKLTNTSRHVPLTASLAIRERRKQLRERAAIEENGTAQDQPHDDQTPEQRVKLDAIELQQTQLQAELASLNTRVIRLKERAIITHEQGFTETFWNDATLRHVISGVAKGTDKFFMPFRVLHEWSFLDDLPSNDRPPIVAIETATGAQNIFEFKFPRHCAIMVGNEGKGIHPRVLKKLDLEGRDAIVYIPMFGPHCSLNVSQATSCALYEYRRQYPNG
eukprot:m.68503 g.68503  ORF g.68503 m.68503 type:complete len:293 (-) comp23962_c0_seq1:776-1654(-)